MFWTEAGAARVGYSFFHADITASIAAISEAATPHAIQVAVAQRSLDTSRR